MRLAYRSVALPLAGFAILLSGCNQPSSSASPAPVSAMPASLNGELISQSGVNLNDGSRHQSFDLKLEADTLYRVTSSGVLQQPKLLLLSEDHLLVAGPRAGQLYMQPEKDGTYRLAISGSSPSDYGPFRIDVSTAEAVNGGELQPGAQILGQLQADAGAKGNRYTLQVAEQGLYEMVLRSAEFDTLLTLRGKGVNQTDDDSGGGTDSRVLIALEEGSYQLTAAGIDSGNEGVYSLSFQAWELPEGINLSDGAQLELGEEYSGMLTGHAQTYNLRVEQAGLLQLSMRSDEADSFLELAGMGINSQDDDSGGGYDALMSVAVEPGSYRIKASQLNSGEGLFTLQAELIQTLPLEGSIAPAETRTGQLGAGQTSQAVLSIQDAGLYRIILRSTRFDALLGLQGGGVDEQDDDGAGGGNALLEVYLEPGEYQLTAGSYADEGEGSFVLSVSAAL